MPSDDSFGSLMVEVVFRTSRRLPVGNQASSVRTRSSRRQRKASRNIGFSAAVRDPSQAFGRTWSEHRARAVLLVAVPSTAHRFEDNAASREPSSRDGHGRIASHRGLFGAERDDVHEVAGLSPFPWQTKRSQAQDERRESPEPGKVDHVLIASSVLEIENKSWADLAIVVRLRRQGTGRRSGSWSSSSSPRFTRSPCGDWAIRAMRSR